MRPFRGIIVWQETLLSRENIYRNTADREVLPEMTLQWHQAHFTNLKNVFLPTEFLWSSTVSQVSLTRYFWAGVSGITADFSVRFLEEDPQPILIPNADTCIRFKKLKWKTISAKKISIVLAYWQRFSFMTCGVWHHFYSLYGCLQVERLNVFFFLKNNNFIANNY